jgi:hypothetical protein
MMTDNEGLYMIFYSATIHCLFLFFILHGSFVHVFFSLDGAYFPANNPIHVVLFLTFFYDL